MKNIIKTVVAVSALFTSNMSFADDLRVLTYGDSNTWGWNPIKEGFPAKRFDDETRWSGILEAKLNEKLDKKVVVVVDGLVGRNTSLLNQTDVGDVTKADFDGSLSLPEAIARNAPLDLVVIMLGTNDVQAGQGDDANKVANAAFDLAKLAKMQSQPTFSAYDAPKVLIIAPPAINDTSKTPLSGLFAAGEAPSKKFSESFKKVAKERGENLFDAGAIVNVDGIDGIHFTAENHKTLGEAVSEKVAELISQ